MTAALDDLQPIAGPIGAVARQVDAAVLARRPRWTWREAMLVRARQLLGTPWAHRGRVTAGQGAGLDFLGLVRECHLTATVGDAGTLPDLDHYLTGYSTGPTVEAIEDLLIRWGLRGLPARQAEPGDVLMFAMPGAHLGVVSGEGKMIHAGWARSTCEAWTTSQTLWGQTPVCAFTMEARS